ncbi:hypothetical protein HUT16_27425 [Kitasatospora sp. NA04385]|uniref:hypothetical protein n=1 Tax=Kitasatospora sp. NA04385 TaxID=2742135 RepID=UPI0015912A1C|nr:hypothetical protein [Kitasatospora sp. NA04385]QKW22312.1 hypothetical protein HUT16_27425 [Kitasatospora sp. NA04385]
MLTRVPRDLPADAITIGDLKAQLHMAPDDMLVVAQRPDAEEGTFALGWAVKAHVLSESGHRVPVIGLPQVDPDDPQVMTVSLMTRVIADLPDHALPVTIWESGDGPLQAAIGEPKFGNLVNEDSGVSVKVVVLPGVPGGMTGDAYDDLVYSLGWE